MPTGVGSASRSKCSTRFGIRCPTRWKSSLPGLSRESELRFDLYRVVLPWHGVVPPLTAGSPPRLAILPFANISPDPKDEYFADGLTEELISVCSQIRGLRVIARTSVAQYRSASKPIAQIGEELGVGSVLEGSVRKIGNRLRVTVQLIDVATQEHRWSESYNRELDDVFAIQAEVARMTAGALRVELLGTDREAIERRPTSNLEAYQLYLRGIHATYAMTETTEDESFTEAIRCLEGAIRIDPTFTLAYSYLADLVVGGAQAGELTHPSQGNERARQLVDRALELDPNSSAAHSARGNIARFAEFDWGLAESEYRKAISLNPSNSRAHLRLGLLLANLARFDEADDELRLTVELDPFEWPAAGWWSMILFRHGATEAAIALAKSTRDLIPSYHWPHVILAWYYSGAGRWEDARKEAELSKGPLIRWMRFLRAIVFTFLEEKDEAKLLLQEFEAASKKEYVPPSWLAGLNAMLGNTGRALELLEGGQEAGDPELDYQWEYFDPIRDDPRFTAMLRRLKLPTEVTWQRVTPRTGP